MLKKWVIAILLILGVPLISAAIIDSDLQGELQNKNEIDVITIEILNKIINTCYKFKNQSL